MGAGTYHDLVGTWGYASGASGSVTIPSGAVVIQIVVHATATSSMTIFGGASIPLIAGTSETFRFIHTLVQSGNESTVTGSTKIVFTATDSYFVEYVRAGNT